MSVKRTYGSRVRQNIQPVPSSPPSTLSSSPAVASPETRKRPLQRQISFGNIPSRPSKRLKLSSKSSPSNAKKPQTKQSTLTQLHFCIDQNVFRTCPKCDFSYTKGAPDDEALHRAHCTRVLKGMEWGREEEKERVKAGVVEVAYGVKLNDGKKGRIIAFPAGVGGKIGSKLTALLETINLILSSPPLTHTTLQSSKVYLFLLPHETSTSREKIVGCVIAQRISKAMSIAPPGKITSSSSDTSSPTSNLVPVDAAAGIFCYPELLPTPMGISRLFVAATHRRQGIASKLLTAAAQTLIHGCPLDPHKGEIAFSQPTGDGTAVMRKWGGDAVRIYEES